MSAPYDVPAVLKSIVPKSTDPKCEALNKSILQFPLRLYQLMAWMFTGVNISDDFRAQLFPAGYSFETYALTAPSGRFLECLGQAVSRPISAGGSADTYSDLWDAIGTTYGAGDAATTFNIPHRSGRSAIGAGQLDDAGDAGDSYVQGDQIGAETVTLEMSELPAEPPPLGDDILKLVVKKSSGPIDLPAGASVFAVEDNANTDHADNALGDLGDGDAHNNKSPSLVLRCYIAY